MNKPAPIITTEPPAPIKGPRQLANWLTSYATYTANTEAPREFHMWAGISTIAGALGRKCWMDMGTFTLFPAFYIVFVAPPGIATKSTTAGLGMEMLKTSRSTKVFEGSITWQAVMDELMDCQKQIEIDGKKLAMSSMHLFASELGVFLKKEDTSMVDLLVDLWDGKNRIERRTRGGGVIDVPRPFLNMIGCTTPAWLSSYAEAYMIEGGFFSRSIFVYADTKDRLIAYPNTTIDIELKSALENDLKRISQIKGDFTLTDEAKQWGEIWYHDLWRNPPETIAGERFQSYRSRRQSHLHKVAMVLSAAESSDRIITLNHMQLAEQMLILAESHLVCIHESIVTSEKLQAYRLIVKAVRNTPIDKQTLFRELASRITYAEFQAGVDAAIFSGAIKQMQVGTQLLLKAGTPNG